MPWRDYLHKFRLVARVLFIYFMMELNMFRHIAMNLSPKNANLFATIKDEMMKSCNFSS